MDDEEPDVTLIAAVSVGVGLIVGALAARSWHRRKTRKEIDEALGKMELLQELQMQMNQWMLDNIGVLDHDAFWEQLHEKTQYMNMVAHEVFD